jgi:anti-sigma factor RsiW
MNKSMPCEGCWSTVSDYVDGRLKGRRLAAVERHLAACPACRELLQDETRLRRLLSQEPVPMPPPAFWERCLQAAAASLPARQFRARRLWKPLLGLTASVAAVAISLLWILPGQQRPEPWLLTEAPTNALPSPYVMRHAEFEVGHPLHTSSHYLLLAARTEAGSGLGWRSESVDLTNDGTSPGGR